MDLPCGKVRTHRGAPHNAVELFPWIAIIAAIEIDDSELSFRRNDHIPHMIVAVLKTLRSPFEVWSVFLKIGDDFLVTVKLYAAVFVLLYFSVYFSVSCV